MNAHKISVSMLAVAVTIIGLSVVNMKHVDLIQSSDMAEPIIRPIIQHPVYKYSVIPGGVHTPDELKERLKDDLVAQEHYKDFNPDEAHVKPLSGSDKFFVSYRMNDRIYWTRNPVFIKEGELVLSSGGKLVRVRCGNRLSWHAESPVAVHDEPPLEELDLIEPPEVKTSQILSMPLPLPTLPTLPVVTQDVWHPNPPPIIPDPGVNRHSINTPGGGGGFGGGGGSRPRVPPTVPTPTNPTPVAPVTPDSPSYPIPVYPVVPPSTPIFDQIIIIVFNPPIYPVFPVYPPGVIDPPVVNPPDGPDDPVIPIPPPHYDCKVIIPPPHKGPEEPPFEPVPEVCNLITVGLGIIILTVVRIKTNKGN